MIKPTSEEVTRYAYKKGFILDGEEFCSFYESKGWVIGKSPMKSWQAAVLTWKHRSIREGRFKPVKSNASVLDLSKIEEAKKKSQDLMDREWERRQLIRRAAEREALKIQKIQENYG